MSSKIPVSIPHRRDVKQFHTPKKENEDQEGSKSPLMRAFAAGAESNNSNKKTPMDKFKHIRSKVNTHWSPEEKKRSGLCTYFARKGTGENSAIMTSPEMQRQAIKITKRKSFSSVTISVDPIETAINQLKMTTSPSTSSSSSSASFVSLPEWPSSYE